MLRRAALSPAANTPSSPFEHDEAGQRIRYAGCWLSLTRLEYRLLATLPATLLAAPSHIHSRAAQVGAVWGESTEANDRTVDTHVKTLRAKLRELTPDRDPITTHRGLG